MDRHPAGQEETLMSNSVELGTLRVQNGPRSSQNCLKFVAMGLLVAALVGFILYSQVTSSGNQEAPIVSKPVKTEIHHESNNSGPGVKNIFKTTKAGTYLICGLVTFSSANDEDEEFMLEQTWDGDSRTIQKQNPNCSKMFILQKLLLAENITIRIKFGSNFNCSFYIFEM